MIFTAGLSPAWQQIMQFDSLRLGEVNRAAQVHWCASGKVLNVAIASSQLEAKASLLSTIGGPSGESIRKEIEHNGIHADWIELEQPTRVCTTILESGGLTTELVENAGPVPDRILEEFIDRFRIHAQVADAVVLTGSIPSNAPEEYYARLIHNIPVPMLLDVRGPGLIQCLPFEPFLVKPNREELAMTLDREIEEEATLISAMQQINSRGARWVVVSDGPAALYASNAEEGTFRCRPPKVDVINPIGCGDCLAAGIAVAHSRGNSVLDAIRFGIGSAAQNATQLLPARIDPQTAQELADKIEIEKL